MSPDRCFGLHYVLVRFHGGIRSREYRLMCKLGIMHRTDRGARLLPRDEWAEARRWAAHYTRWMRRR